MKLSKRLKYIYSEIVTDYDEIWDLCCDHGDLGISLLQSKKCKKLHFVDQVEKITSILSRKLVDINLVGKYEVHTIDARDIQLTSNLKNLVIISGVGGEVCISILSSLLKKFDLENTDFLLCVHYHIFNLREFLIQENFKLKKESLIFDRGRPYEFLNISRSEGEEVSSVGKTMWDYKNRDHFNYLSKMIKHYEVKNNFDENDQLNKALLLYRELLSKFCEV